MKVEESILLKTELLEDNDIRSYECMNQTMKHMMTQWAADGFKAMAYLILNVWFLYLNCFSISFSTQMTIFFKKLIAIDKAKIRRSLAGNHHLAQKKQTFWAAYRPNSAVIVDEKACILAYPNLPIWVCKDPSLGQLRSLCRTDMITTEGAVVLFFMAAWSDCRTCWLCRRPRGPLSCWTHLHLDGCSASSIAASRPPKILRTWNSICVLRY